MSQLNAFVAELRERRLWPVVVVLLVGIVAVPMVLAKSPSPQSIAASPPSGLPVSSSPATPSVSLGSSPTTAPPHGLGRDPFTQPFGSSTPASASARGIASSLPTGPASPSSTAGGGSGSGGSSGGATGGLSGLGPATAPASTTPTTSPSEPITPPTEPDRRVPAGLTSTQAYRVTLAITDSGGGLNTISSLERLSVLPSQRQPLLVELGVLRGGHRVLFAVESGAVVSGPGRCTPGPIDCQILSLAPAQTETLSSADHAVSHVLLAVTAVKAARYPSAAAARKARRAASASGRKLLSASALSALSLFQYNPGLGAVLDMRNVKVKHH